MAADYSDKPFYLQYPAATATIITLVIAGSFIYAVVVGGTSGHHGPAAHGSGSAAHGASAAPATSAAKPPKP
jgi:hypothetical protein